MESQKATTCFQVFCNMSLCQWMSGSLHFKRLWCLIFMGQKDTTILPNTANHQHPLPLSHCHITKDLNPQQHLSQISYLELHLRQNKLC